MIKEIKFNQYSKLKMMSERVKSCFYSDNLIIPKQK